MAFSEKKPTSYKLITECGYDSYMDVLKEHIETYEKASVIYISDQNCYNIVTTLKKDPRKESEYDLFVDTVRNLANRGWPEYDPFRLEEVYGE